MSSFPPPTTAPAGWYPDPEGGSCQRYFDGLAWAPPSPRPTPPIPIVSATAVVAIMIASLIAARLTASAMLWLGISGVLVFSVLTVVAYGPALLAVIAIIRMGQGRSEMLGVRPRWLDVLFGPVVWIALVVSQILVGIVLIVLDVPVQSNLEGLGADRLGWATIIVLLISAVVVAPVVEELVFRGVVLRAAASRMPAVVALLLQGLLFGVIHLDLDLGVGAFGLVIMLTVIGIILGVSVIVLGRIWPAILAHAIFNAVALAVAFTGVLDGVS